jgi:integrase
METIALVALQHTLDHGPDCAACEADRLELNRTTEMRHLKFREAAELVLADERFYLKPENALLSPEDKSLRVGIRTYRDHADFTRRLNRFYGEIQLFKIHEGHWRSYQKQRLVTAGAGVINHEQSFLKRVLERAGLWDAIKSKCHTLHVPKSQVGRSMTPEVKNAILVAASSRPRWQTFYWCGLMMLNTTCNQGEIIHLRIRDLDMKERVLRIREGGGPLKLQADGSFRHATKTPQRERELPMNSSAFLVCTLLLKRYTRICRRLKLEPSPDHYLFAGRARGGKLDPTRHLISFKRAWAAICAHAGVNNLRIEDFRHEASTQLQHDSLVAPGTVENIMGHKPGSDTKDGYRHSNLEAMHKALERIEVKPVRPVESVDNVVEFVRSHAVGGGKK